MRNPETTKRHRSPRRAGPGHTVLAGLFIVVVGLLVALRGAYLVASAIGPAGTLEASPALSGLVLLVFGALVECVGVGVFSKRLVALRILQPVPATASLGDVGC